MNEKNNQEIEREIEGINSEDDEATDHDNQNTREPENASANEEISENSECCSKNRETQQESLVDKLTKELGRQKDIFLRTAAEYENFRKRSEREKRAIYNDAVSDTIAIMLTVADSLDFAIKAQDGATEEYQKGLEMIKNQLNEAFNRLGVKTIGKEGDEFDPNLHNAVSHIEDDNIAENTVAEVFQKGYVLGEKIIRPAMVKVAN